jgi:hypothetical protein
MNKAMMLDPFDLTQLNPLCILLKKQPNNILISNLYLITMIYVLNNQINILQVIIAVWTVVIALIDQKMSLSSCSRVCALTLKSGGRGLCFWRPRRGRSSRSRPSTALDHQQMTWNSGTACKDFCLAFYLWRSELKCVALHQPMFLHKAVSLQLCTPEFFLLKSFIYRL